MNVVHCTILYIYYIELSNIVFLSWACDRKGFYLQKKFSSTYLVPLLLEGFIMMFAWRCFPLLGLELGFFDVDGGVFLIHLAVQAQAISCTSMSPGWATALNSGESEDDSLHTLRQPSPRVEPTTYQRPYSQTPLILLFIVTVVPI